MDPIEFKVGSSRSPIVLSLKEYQGRKLIDIRKYFTSKSNPDDLMPTRKGITLTGAQFSIVLQVLTENASTIEAFFESSTDLDLNLNQEFRTTIDQPLGRLFHVSFENNDTNVSLDKFFASKLEENQRTTFINFLIILHKALIDTLEDEGDINLVLDSFNNGICRSVC